MVVRLVVLVTLVLGFLSGCTQPGVRLLHVDFTRDGELLLRTYYEDPDARPALDVFDYVAMRPIMAEDENSKVVPLAKDPLRAALEGPVVIEVRHVDSSLRRVVTEGLQLVRDDDTSQRWYVPPDEFERLSR